MPKNKLVKKASARPKTKNSARAKASSTPATDFSGTFEALKKAMAFVVPELKVIADEPQKYYLVTKSKSWKGGAMYFGAVMMGKAYVSYHLMPLYVCTELAKAVSLDLRKRMQGKSCFNFRAPDQALFQELGELTKAGLEKYRAKNLL
jgi:hypothetical protein